MKAFAAGRAGSHRLRRLQGGVFGLHFSEGKRESGYDMARKRSLS